MAKAILEENERMIEESKIADVLSKLSPKAKKVVLNQMYTAIAICQSVEQVLKEGA